MTANAFKGTCERCGKTVEPGEGLILGKTGTEWDIVHRDCLPQVKPRARKPDLTKADILAIIQRKGSFSVSMRHRDLNVRKKLYQLKKNGQVSGGKRQKDRFVYFKVSEYDL